MFAELYQNYLDELEANGFTKFEDDITGESCIKAQSDPCHTWLPVETLTEKGIECVGFAIIGQSPDCHPDCDYFVCQAYVKPEYREQGLMTKKMTEWLKDNPGIYCMDILKKNEYAKRFWESLFKKNGYKRAYLRDIPHGADDSDTWYFEKER